MTALLLHFWPYVAGAIAAAFAGWKLRQSGRNAERMKQMTVELAAAKDRLDMDREASDIERRVSGLSDGAAREEAMRWSRH